MCDRPAHYVTAACHGAVASLFTFGALPPASMAALDQPGVRVAATLAIAAAAVPTAGGKWSPDIDQFGIWKKIDRCVPDELLLFGGPMRHRGLSHWWGIPGAATFGLWWACQHLPLAAAVLLLTVAGWPVLGWWSHLLSDFWVGGRYGGGKRPDADDPAGGWDRKSMLDADDGPRGPGIPLLGWTLHVGTGWRVGTVYEWVYVIVCLAVGAAAVYGSWRGVTLHWDSRVAVGVLVLMLAVGVHGRVKTTRRGRALARS